MVREKLIAVLIGAPIVFWVCANLAAIGMVLFVVFCFFVVRALYHSGN